MFQQEFDFPVRYQWDDQLNDFIRKVDKPLTYSAATAHNTTVFEPPSLPAELESVVAHSISNCQQKSNNKSTTILCYVDIKPPPLPISRQPKANQKSRVHSTRHRHRSEKSSVDICQVEGDNEVDYYALQEEEEEEERRWQEYQRHLDYVNVELFCGCIRKCSCSCMFCGYADCSCDMGFNFFPDDYFQYDYYYN